MRKIEGLIAATFSTLYEDGTLNLDVVPALVNKLVADGLTGVYICGTNGEGPNMTTQERMAVAEAYVRAANKRLLVLVHVGHNSITESKKLAAHAESIGADAISSVAGFYFKPTSVHNLVMCMSEIAAAAPNTPFYYYHIPTLTGVGMDMLQFLELSETKIPNLAGIKYTASTLHEYQACLNYKQGKYDILFGYDEMLLGALAVGAKGAIGSTYTVAPGIYQKLMQAFQLGDMETARAMQLKSIDFVKVIVKFNPIQAQKAALKLIGYDCGPVRLPLDPFDKERTEEFRSDLEEIGFFEWFRSAVVI